MKSFLILNKTKSDKRFSFTTTTNVKSIYKIIIELLQNSIQRLIKTTSIIHFNTTNKRKINFSTALLLKMKLFFNFKSNQMGVPVLPRKEMPIQYILIKFNIWSLSSNYSKQ